MSLIASKLPTLSHIPLLKADRSETNTSTKPENTRTVTVLNPATIYEQGDTLDVVTKLVLGCGHLTAGVLGMSAFVFLCTAYLGLAATSLTTAPSLAIVRNVVDAGTTLLGAALCKRIADVGFFQIKEAFIDNNMSRLF